MAVIDRIKYDAESDEWFVWKYDSEKLCLGAQLVVNQAQEVLFVKGGQALDVFGPGTHTLSTGNIPLLSKLVNLPFGGKTPFTAEVWYINKHVKRDLKWGTTKPIALLDPVYNYPVKIRAFGRFGIRIDDSRRFITQLVGTLQDFVADKIREYFMGEIVQRLSDALSRYLVERKISVLQVSAKLNELSKFVADDLREEFDRFGLEVVNFNVESVNIPEEDMQQIQKVLGDKMEIEQLGSATVGPGYTSKKSFDVLEKAADRDGGVAGNLLAGGLGLGIGLGAGLPAGRQIGEAMNPKEEDASGDALEKLRKLKAALDEGLITKDDYEARKKVIIEEL